MRHMRSPCPHTVSCPRIGNLYHLRGYNPFSRLNGRVYHPFVGSNKVDHFAFLASDLQSVIDGLSLARGEIGSELDLVDPQSYHQYSAAEMAANPCAGFYVDGDALRKALRTCPVPGGYVYYNRIRAGGSRLAGMPPPGGAGSVYETIWLRLLEMAAACDGRADCDAFVTGGDYLGGLTTSVSWARGYANNTVSNKVDCAGTYVKMPDLSAPGWSAKPHTFSVAFSAPTTSSTLLDLGQFTVPADFNATRNFVEVSLSGWYVSDGEPLLTSGDVAVRLEGRTRADTVVELDLVLPTPATAYYYNTTVQGVNVDFAPGSSVAVLLRRATGATAAPIGWQDVRATVRLIQRSAAAAPTTPSASPPPAAAGLLMPTSRGNAGALTLQLSQSFDLSSPTASRQRSFNVPLEWNNTFNYIELTLLAGSSWVASNASAKLTTTGRAYLSQSGSSGLPGGAATFAAWQLPVLTNVTVGVSHYLVDVPLAAGKQVTLGLAAEGGNWRNATLLLEMWSVPTVLPPAKPAASGRRRRTN